jgi:hypothetical protein
MVDRPPIDVDVTTEAVMDSLMLQLAVVANAEGAASTEVHNGGADDSDEEQVDEEIVVDTPLAHEKCDAGMVTPPSIVSPAVCRFASPPVVFQRSRQPPSHGHCLLSPDREL